MINKIKKFFQKDKMIGLLERAVKRLEDDKQELLKSIELLRKENDQWRQVSKIVDDKVKELVDRKFGDFIITAGSGGLCMSSTFDNFKDKIEKKEAETTIDLVAIKKEIESLQKETKATDKVFFLADKIEKLLAKI